MFPSNRYNRFVRAAAGAVVYAGALLAQSAPPGPIYVKGELSNENGARVDAFLVELSSQGRPVGRAQVFPDGGFEFRSVPLGQYELKVMNWRGDVVRREFVSVHENGPALSIKLPSTEGARPIAGTVSMAALLHPVPAKARKEYLKADGALRDGAIDRAVQHLRKAIEIYPDYMEAHNNLGARYVIARDFNAAAAEFTRASELDPKSTVPILNLALTLVALKRYEDAAATARRALAIDSGLVQARYTLGLAASATGRCTTEALEDSRAATAKIPKARLVAARLFVCRGEVKLAASELRGYLEAPGAENRAAVEEWLAKLQPVATR